MQKSILTMRLDHSSGNDDQFRTIFKTRHGRVVFLSVQLHDSYCTIQDCFYLDRNQGRTGPARYSARPQMLRTIKFPAEQLLSVIEAELDKKFYGVIYTQDENTGLPLDEYIRKKAEQENRKYRFLIMVGEGECHNDLPARLRTRLKNKLHRSIYVELAYYKEGQGVVKHCCYCDRQYKRQDIQMIPPMLTSCFFPYTKQGILTLLNHEICCDFTHILVTDGIDLDSNHTPLCGAV